MPDPRELLPTVMHSPVRLAVLASLKTVQSADFKTLVERLEISDQELSRQLATLEKEGLVEIMKSRRGRKVVTQVRLSSGGRQDFEKYLEQLRRVAFD